MASCANPTPSKTRDVRLRDFGEIRSLCQGAPSRLRWGALLETLEAMPPASRAVAVGYAQSFLESWPVELRQVPERWLVAITKEQAAPEHVTQLARALVWSQVGSAVDRFRAMGALGRQPWARHLEQMSFERVGLNPATLFLLLRSPVFEGLRRVQFSHSDCGRLTSVGLSRLETLRGVHHMGFDGLGLTDALVTGMARASRLEALRSLSLAYNRLSAHTLGMLIEHEAWRGLESLDLSSNMMAEDGLGPLDEVHGSARLKHLNLARNGLGRRMDALARSTLSDSLRSLDVSDNPLADEGVRAMAGGDWGRLRSLVCRGCGIGAAGARVLGQSPWMGGVTSVDLSYNVLFHPGERQHMPEYTWGVQRLMLASTGMRTQDVEDVFGGLRWSGLEALSLGFNVLGDDGFEALSRAQDVWTHLSCLSLERCHLSLKRVPALPTHARIRALDLSGNTISVDGLLALLAQPAFEQLERLSLKHCGLDDDGLVALLEHEHLAGLRELELQGNAITSDGAQPLMQGFALPRLRTLNLSRNDLSQGGAPSPALFERMDAGRHWRPV